MILFLSILFFVLGGFCYFLSDKKIYAPAIVVSFIWAFSLLLFATMGHILNPIGAKFLVPITIWVLCFCFFALLAQSLYVRTPFKNVTPSQTARDIYFYFSLATLPFLIVNVYNILQLGVISNPFLALRLANIEGTTTSFFVGFWLVAYVLELFCASSKNKFRITLLLLLNLFYAFIALAKSYFLLIFIVSIVILLYRKQIKIKHVFLLGLVLVAVFIIIQTIRASQDTHLKFEEFISMYLLGGMPAFETIQPKSSAHWGENTFRFFYALRYKMGLSSIHPVNPILNYVKVPILTNTYTVLYPFYKDFGLGGVAFFSSILGFFLGYLFNQTTKKDNFAIIILAIFTSGTIVEFSGEVPFTFLSQNLQYIVIALIPFIISKHHLFERKNKDG